VGSTRGPQTQRRESNTHLCWGKYLGRKLKREERCLDHGLSNALTNQSRESHNMGIHAQSLCSKNPGKGNQKEKATKVSGCWASKAIVANQGGGRGDIGKTPPGNHRQKKFGRRTRMGKNLGRFRWKGHRRLRKASGKSYCTMECLFFRFRKGETERRKWRKGMREGS